MSDYKILLHGKEARQKLAKGANELATAVVSTYGPLSRNVALNRQYPAPQVLHDGVSVANEIRLKDPFEDMGAALLREAASKTNDLAGDGTTTATLLANTLVQEGIKLVEGGVVDGVITGKINPMVMRKSLLEYAELIVSKLQDKAIKIIDKNDYQKIATVSSSSEEIGKIVADAIEKVGSDGVVMVEEASGFESSLEIQEGMEFDNGFLSPYFVTDADRMIATYEDAYILLTDYTIADPMQLVPIVEKVMKDGNKPLLIIANDVVGPALQSLALTKVRAGAKIVAVVAPEFADRRKEMLEDIAMLTGGVVIAKDLEKNLVDVELKHLGRARSISVTQTHTMIAPSNPDPEDVRDRIESIKKQIDAEDNAYRKQRLQARLSKLSQSVAIINVGGGSAAEISDKKQRVIDAVYATKAALAEGVVAGGGVSLRDIGLEMNKEEDNKVLDLVIHTLYAPMRTLLSNAGIDKNIFTGTEGTGIDVFTGEFVDMFKRGIIDPVKVTKLAVRHAFSVAATMLTTDTLISDDSESDQGIQKVRPV